MQWTLIKTLTCKATVNLAVGLYLRAYTGTALIATDH